jgi:hypothetical protein
MQMSIIIGAHYIEHYACKSIFVLTPDNTKDSICSISL